MQKAELRTSTKQSSVLENCCKQTSVAHRCLLSAGMRFMLAPVKGCGAYNDRLWSWDLRETCVPLSSIAELDEAWMRLCRELHGGEVILATSSGQLER